jgi:hypothetical protein
MRNERRICYFALCTVAQAVGQNIQSPTATQKTNTFALGPSLSSRRHPLPPLAASTAPPLRLRPDLPAPSSPTRSTLSPPSPEASGLESTDELAHGLESTGGSQSRGAVAEPPSVVDSRPPLLLLLAGEPWGRRRQRRPHRLILSSQSESTVGLVAREGGGGALWHRGGEATFFWWWRSGGCGRR